MKMHEYWDKAVKIAAAVGGAIAGFLGGWDMMLRVLVSLMAVDYASGLIVAWMGKSRKTENGYLDSNVGFKGIAKKVLVLLMVAVAAMTDKALGGESTSVFRSMVIWFYIANEGLSILENLALAGVPFPASMKNALEQMRKKADEQKPPDADEV